MFQTPPVSGNRALTVLAAFLWAAISFGGPPWPAAADDSTPQDSHQSSETLGRLLQTYCADCHQTETAVGNPKLTEGFPRLDRLLGPSETPGRVDEWERILVVVRDGRMPPAEAAGPSDADRAALVGHIEKRLSRLAEAARRAGHYSLNRRLTREEYNHTMRRLLGVDAQFADLLPPDPIAATGYRTDKQRLGLSSLRVEAYLDSARRALKRYIQFGDLNAESVLYRIEFEDLFYSTAKRYETRQRAPEPIDRATFDRRRAAAMNQRPVFVDPLISKLPGAFSEEERLRAAIPKLHQQYVALPRRLAMGELIVRVRAAGTADRFGRYPRMRVEAGITLGDGCAMNKRPLGEVDVKASPDRPETYEFRIRLEDVPTKGPLRDGETFDRLSVFDMDQIFISNVTPDRLARYDLGRGGYADPATGSERIAQPLRQMKAAGVSLLHLDCLEIEMWPGHGRGNTDYRWRAPSICADEEMDIEWNRIREFVRRFMREAYRRPISTAEVATKEKLFRNLRNQELSPRDSLLETLAAVLISPAFLYRESTPADGSPSAEQTRPTGGQIGPHQLAARLSYTLWLAPPDRQLSRLADEAAILEPDVLRQEAKRLLSDPRRRRFLRSFGSQWLRLDKLPTVAVNREANPFWDDDLAAASIQETLGYFVEVFESDASAVDLIDSDYAILNDRLADHYGLPPVGGGQLRRVALPADSIRGGLLTQASVLTMNSDGVDSHPIRRGVWLLDRVLHQPPPPAPPNVPPLEDADPDFRGLSLIERIRLHRQSAACRDCHQVIDPWGIPFEQFDATGRLRDPSAAGIAEHASARRVESAAQLPDGPRIDGAAALKAYLRTERRRQFANSIVHHLLAYTLGRPPGYADRQQVKMIQNRFADSEYQLRELVLAIVESSLFRQ